MYFGLNFRDTITRYIINKKLDNTNTTIIIGKYKKGTVDLFRIQFVMH